jgi:hypothetical protein
MNIVRRALQTVGIFRGEVRAADFAPRVSPQGAPSNLPGTRTSDGDYALAMMPEPINPRTQRGSVIRELTSNRAHCRWQYNCMRCGETNFVNVGDEDRQVACGACKFGFSIRGIATEAVKTARDKVNARGGRLLLTDPISPKDWDTWRFTLPERIPSLETSPREAMKRSLQDQLGESDRAGEIDWTGEKQPHTEGLGNSTAAFDAPLNSHGGGPRSSPEWLAKRARQNQRADIIQAERRKQLLAGETPEERSLREKLEAAED